VALQLLQSGRPQQARPADVLALQRTVGNAAVKSLLVNAGRSGPPVTVQRAGRGGMIAKAAKAAGGSMLRIGRWPFDRIARAIERLKRGRARNADRRAIEEIAQQLGYDELRNKKAWERDAAAIHAIEERITQEAVARGTTINF
jgi:hypothetical protein